MSQGYCSLYVLTKALGVVEVYPAVHEAERVCWGDEGVIVSESGRTFGQIEQTVRQAHLVRVHGHLTYSKQLQYLSKILVKVKPKLESISNIIKFIKLDVNLIFLKIFYSQESDGVIH